MAETIQVDDTRTPVLWGWTSPGKFGSDSTEYAQGKGDATNYRVQMEVQREPDCGAKYIQSMQHLILQDCHLRSYGGDLEDFIKVRVTRLVDI